jgi:hypothetical protein
MRRIMSIALAAGIAATSFALIGAPPAKAATYTCASGYGATRGDMTVHYRDQYNYWYNMSIEGIGCYNGSSSYTMYVVSNGGGAYYVSQGGSGNMFYANYDMRGVVCIVGVCTTTHQNANMKLYLSGAGNWSGTNACSGSCTYNNVYVTKTW